MHMLQHDIQQGQDWRSCTMLAAVQAVLLGPCPLYEHPHGGNNPAYDGEHLLSISVTLLSPRSTGAVLPAPLRRRSDAASPLRVRAAMVLQPCGCGSHWCARK